MFNISTWNGSDAIAVAKDFKYVQSAISYATTCVLCANNFSNKYNNILSE